MSAPRAPAPLSWYSSREHHTACESTQLLNPSSAPSREDLRPAEDQMGDKGLRPGSHASGWPEIDTSVAHVARVYAYLLGGKAHLPAPPAPPHATPPPPPLPPALRPP